MIREQNITEKDLLLNTVTFKKWQGLAEMCYDAHSVKFINTVINTKVCFNSEKKDVELYLYEETLKELIMIRSDLMNKVLGNRSSVQRKIQKFR